MPAPTAPDRRCPSRDRQPPVSHDDVHRRAGAECHQPACAVTPEEPDDLRTLHAYSPYHRVVANRRYPATLIMSNANDDRVDPMHARKFAAALQAASTGGPVWLRVEARAGHKGAGLVKAAVEELADEFAFALWALGGPGLLNDADKNLD